MSDGVVQLRASGAADVPTLVAGRDEESRRFLGPGDDEPRPTACIVVGGSVVGWVDFDDEREWLAPGEVNVGYHVFAEHRGRGYASRAVQLLGHHLAVRTDRRAMMLSIDADNALIAGFTGVTFGIHICRGNARTIDPKTGKLVPQWHREGTYDTIAEKLFNTLKHQRILLEYDSDRAGGFEPLRLVPKDKIVVLGLVSTKNSDKETVDELTRRLDQASKFLPLDQLALSPQCGFGGIDSKVLSEDEMWKKLECIVQTARQVWG